MEIILSILIPAGDLRQEEAISLTLWHRRWKSWERS